MGGGGVGDDWPQVNERENQSRASCVQSLWCESKVAARSERMSLKPLIGGKSASNQRSPVGGQSLCVNDSMT